MTKKTICPAAGVLLAAAATVACAQQAAAPAAAVPPPIVASHWYGGGGARPAPPEVLPPTRSPAGSRGGPGAPTHTARRHPTRTHASFRYTLRRQSAHQR